MNKYYVWMAFLENISKSNKNSCCNIREILTLFHDVEVVVRFHIKDLEHLIEHFTMLACDAYDCFKFIRTFLELLN